MTLKASLLAVAIVFTGGIKIAQRCGYIFGGLDNFGKVWSFLRECMIEAG